MTTVFIRFDRMTEDQQALVQQAYAGLKLRNNKPKPPESEFCAAFACSARELGNVGWLSGAMRWHIMTYMPWLARCHQTGNP